LFILDAVHQQPLLLCIVIGIGFASFCEMRLILQKRAAAAVVESKL
jgi:hypothetical protein